MARSIPRLTWFELQVCPTTFRFAAVPGQPILIGFGGPEGTALIRYDEAGETFLGLMDALDDIVRRHRVLDTEMQRPESAFEDEEAMAGPSLHFRFACGDEVSWASVFPLDAMPANVRATLQECEELGREILATCPTREVSGEEARALLHSGGEPPPPASVARVAVRLDGRVSVDGRPVAVGEMPAIAARLKASGAGVMYYREGAEDEGSDSAQAVFLALVEARLPIRLCEREDEAPGDGQWYWPPPE
jgi:hypothetical protein